MLATLGKNPLPFPIHLAAALGTGPAAPRSLSLVLGAVKFGKRDTAIGTKTPWLEQVQGKNGHDRHDAADEAGNERDDCVWVYHREHLSGEISIRLSRQLTQAD
jgi:hypothetical protein